MSKHHAVKVSMILFCQLAYQHGCADFSHLTPWIMDGRQVRLHDGRDGFIVKSSDGNLFGNPDASGLQFSYTDHRRGIVAREDPIWKGIHFKDRLDGLAAVVVTEA